MGAFSDELKILIDLITSFVSRRRKLKRERFDEIYSPIHKSMEIVHANYLAMISEVQAILDPEVIDVSESEAMRRILKAHETLLLKRREYELLREKLRSYNDFEAVNDLPYEEQRFLMGVAKYFTQSGHGSLSYSVKTLEDLKVLASSGKEEIKNFAEMALPKASIIFFNKMREVNEAFNALQLSLMK